MGRCSVSADHVREPFPDAALAGTFGLLLAVWLLHGFGNGLGSSIVMTMGTDLSPKEHAGEFLGVWFLVSGLGAIIGPAIIGYLSELFTMGAAAAATGGIEAAGGVYLLFFVAEMRNRKNR